MLKSTATISRHEKLLRSPHEQMWLHFVVGGGNWYFDPYSCLFVLHSKY